MPIESPEDKAGCEAQLSEFDDNYNDALAQHEADVAAAEAAQNQQGAAPTGGATNNQPPATTAVTAPGDPPPPQIPFSPSTVNQTLTGLMAGISSTPPPILLYCTPAVREGMLDSWNLSGHGNPESHNEAGFFPVMYVGGAIGHTPAQSSFESNRNSFHWNYAGIAYGHVHPDGMRPDPTVPEDINLANRFNVPVFTFGSRGLYVFMPGAAGSTLVRRGLDWLDSCPINKVLP